MRHVQRSDLLDYQTYTEKRDEFRKAVAAVKEARRVHAGDYLTFLFENTDTVRFQVQEMMRVEHIVKEADIQHELDTYNSLLGDAGELGCTLLIEIDDKDQRDEKLRAWRELPEHLYMKLNDGRIVRPTYDTSQMNDEKLSAVQFLKFPVGDAEPVSVGSDLPDLRAEAELTAEQRQALCADLTH